MSIRTIRNSAGTTTGYQAFAGNGGPGLTAYVPAAHRNVSAVLAAAETMLAGIHKDAKQKPPRDPLTGLRLVLHRGRHDDSVPVLYADAVWREKGRNVHRSYSTERHSRLDAVVMVIAEMERGTGTPITMTPRNVLAELMDRFDNTHGR